METLIKIFPRLGFLFLAITANTYGTPAEVAGRLRFCEVTLSQLADFESYESQRIVDGDAVEAKAAQAEELVHFFFGEEHVEAFRSVLREALGNSRSTFTVIDTFFEFGKSHEINEKAEHLRGVSERLRQIRSLTTEQELDESFDPYVVSPWLLRLTSDSYEDIEPLIERWRAAAKKDWWFVDANRGHLVGTLVDMADTYNRFLVGRERFDPERPGLVQTIADLVMVRTVEAIGVEGWMRMVQLISGESWRFKRFGNPEIGHNRMTALMRILFLCELRHPGSIQAETRNHLVSWLVSSLTSEDSRDYGVRYAAAMNLILLDHNHSMIKVASFLNILETDGEGPPVADARGQIEALQSQVHPLQRHTDMLRQTLAQYETEASEAAEPPYVGIVEQLYFRLLSSRAARQGETHKPDWGVGARDHFSSLFRMKEYYDWVNELLDEAQAGEAPPPDGGEATDLGPG